MERSAAASTGTPRLESECKLGLVRKMSGRQVRARTKYFVRSMRARCDPSIDLRLRWTATDLRSQSRSCSSLGQRRLLARVVDSGARAITVMKRVTNLCRSPRARAFAFVEKTNGGGPRRAIETETRGAEETRGGAGSSGGFCGGGG